MSLGARAAAPAPAGARLLVGFAPGISRAAEDALLKRAGARRVGTVQPLRIVTADAAPGRRDAALAALRRDRGVLGAEPDGVARVLDETAPAASRGLASSSESWQVDQLDLQQAWQVTTGAPGVVVAVVDTGVQSDHPDLQGRVLPGHDFVNSDDDASDDNGHGTAIAGIIAGAGEGICPQCEILPVKVLAANGTGDWGTIAAGIVWAADHGAQVINLSIGSAHALDAVGAAVAYALAKGATVVAAAGNDGRDERFYPAAYPGVVSVAGIDQNGARYPWSNYGSWISVAAPGCTDTSWLGGQHTTNFCGTSTAAPFVSGIAGLVRAYEPAATPAAFAAAAVASADPLPDPTTAAGRIDANRVLTALGAPTSQPTLTAAPHISATPAVGVRLSAAVGTWQGAATYLFHWQRSSGGLSWQDVASGSTYTPRGGDRGYRLRVVVTARNPRGSTDAASAATAPVAAKHRS